MSTVQTETTVQSLRAEADAITARVSPLVSPLVASLRTLAVRARELPERAERWEQSTITATLGTAAESAREEMGNALADADGTSDVDGVAYWHAMSLMTSLGEYGRGVDYRDGSWIEWAADLEPNEDWRKWIAR